MKAHAFGLDFGTSKTALSIAKCDGALPTANDITLEPHDGHARIASCVLVDTSGAVPIAAAIGSVAEEEGMIALRPGGDGARRLSSNFKPHIHNRGEARADAGLFLGALARVSEVARELSLWREVSCTVVGRPASWPPEAERILVDLVRDAGFPDPMSLPEPVGALFYHLAVRMKAEDVNGEILVVDWGAGTCDFTVMRNGRSRPEDSWGSNLFGGRLFDDLFCRWILESAEASGEHAEALAKLRATPQYEAYLAWQISREVKEKYSNSLRRKGRAFEYPFPIAVGSGNHRVFLGYFSVGSHEEFERRARAYIASARMIGCLKEARADASEIDRPRLAHLLGGRPVDLLAWASELVMAGGSRVKQVGSVILTGGSTRWPWFEALVGGGDVTPSVRLYTDPAPELSIARGLGRAYAIGAHAGNQLAVLAQVRDAFVRDLVVGFLRPAIEKLCAETVEALLADCYQSDILPVLRDKAATRLETVEANRRIGEAIGSWFGRSGWSRFSSGLDALNEDARAAILACSGRHDMRMSGLFGLAAEACRPIGRRDWARWIDSTNWRDDLVRSVMASTETGLRGVLAAIMRFVAGLLLDPFRSDAEKAAARRAREEDERERLRTHLSAALSSTVINTPGARQWSEQVCVYISETLQNLAEIANPGRPGPRGSPGATSLDGQGE